MTEKEKEPNQNLEDAKEGDKETDSERQAPEVGEGVGEEQSLGNDPESQDSSATGAGPSGGAPE